MIRESKEGKEMLPCRKKLLFMVTAAWNSTTYTFQHTSFLSYEVFFLEYFHIMLIYDPSRDLIVYIPCTPAEFMILARLLSAPSGETIPFEELSLHISGHASNGMKLLQRHISRLKKKLPPSWTIVCEWGIGYR